MRTYKTTEVLFTIEVHGNLHNWKIISTKISIR